MKCLVTGGAGFIGAGWRRWSTSAGRECKFITGKEKNNEIFKGAGLIHTDAHKEYKVAK